jgi:Tfp pilus assembly protein PilN
LAINYLWEISNLLPPEIVITSITFQNEDMLDLKGRTAEMSDVFKFITTLENSTFFKDIQTRYTSRKKLKGVDVNEFELTCPIETDKTPARSKRAGSGRRNQAREDL